jgi:hypothetical protein
MTIQVTREMLLGSYVWGTGEKRLAVEVVGQGLLARQGGEGFGGMVQRTIDHFAYDGAAIRAESEMDRRFFNRREGEEVVEMVQMVADRLGYEAVANVQAVERLINQELPGNIRGTEKVLAWLLERL